MRESTEVGATEFTATLFDLIRRGVYTAKPVTTEKKTWGGLRSQDIADLELSRGQGNHLEAWERPVERVVDGMLDGASERLSRFREQIEDDRTTNAKRFTEFKEDTAKAIDRSAAGTRTAGSCWCSASSCLPRSARSCCSSRSAAGGPCSRVGTTWYLQPSERAPS